MNYYRLIIAYDGTDFQGWHEQPHKQTVEDALYEAFKTAFAKEGYIVAASRTDAGVHALGQVVLLQTSLDLDTHLMQKVWNDKLPSAILIRSLEKVSNLFHPQRNVQQKIYWYHIFTQRPLPFVSRYGWYYRNSFTTEKLQRCLDVFKGTHDFRSFCSSDYQKDTIRTIDDIRLIYIKRYNVYRVEVYGARFLYNMIRRIVGASLYVASRQNMSENDLKIALEAKNPEQTLPNAAACGLLLYKIMYKE